jgi:hypothetical protein
MFVGMLSCVGALYAVYWYPNNIALRPDRAAQMVFAVLISPLSLLSFLFCLQVLIGVLFNSPALFIRSGKLICISRWFFSIPLANISRVEVCWVSSIFGRATFLQISKKNGRMRQVGVLLFRARPEEIVAKIEGAMS